MSRMLWVFSIMIFSFSQGLGKENKFLMVTFPKSGSHLVEKYFTLLTEIGHCYQPAYNHLGLSGIHLFEYNDSFSRRYRGIRKLIVIRDLRDICVSAARWISGFSNFSNWVSQHPTIEEQISLLIEGKLSGFLGFIPYCCEILEKILDEDDEYYIVKFENLIGQKGGGSDRAQMEEIYNISEFIGVSLSRSDVTYIQKNLFGMRQTDLNQLERNNLSWTNTFYKGRIGQWKEVFTSKHIEEFRSRPFYLNYLIKYGYEENEEW